MNEFTKSIYSKFSISWKRVDSWCLAWCLAFPIDVLSFTGAGRARFRLAMTVPCLGDLPEPVLELLMTLRAKAGCETRRYKKHYNAIWVGNAPLVDHGEAVLGSS